MVDVALSDAISGAVDQHTISSSALALSDTDLTDAHIAAAGRAIISVRSGAINIWYDGSAPTTSAGITFLAGERLVIIGHLDISRLQMIRNGATDAVVDILLEG